MGSLLYIRILSVLSIWLIQVNGVAEREERAACLFATCQQSSSHSAILSAFGPLCSYLFVCARLLCNYRALTRSVPRWSETRSIIPSKFIMASGWPDAGPGSQIIRLTWSQHTWLPNRAEDFLSPATEFSCGCWLEGFLSCI